MDVDWSPTGDLLLFETLDEQERYAIWTTPLDGTRQEKIVEGDLPISSPHWSANGDFIYYLRGRSVRELMKLLVSHRTGKAAGSSEIVLSGLQMGGNFTISRDGKQLAYARQVSRANLWLTSTKSSPVGTVDSKQLTSGTGEDEGPVFLRTDDRSLSLGLTAKTPTFS